MKIGEFAEICGTEISVLRFYDKQGLLCPDFIDSFTGYRYYSHEQAAAFGRIQMFKSAGFTLGEIREILSCGDDVNAIAQKLEQKRRQLCAALDNISKIKCSIVGDKLMINTSFIENDSKIYAVSERISGDEFHTACDRLEEAIAENGYQRMSNYMTFGEPDSAEFEIRCEVERLLDTAKTPHESIDLPFEDDDVVGKWIIVGEYAVKSDFFADMFRKEPPVGDQNRELYFLPHGERYWCYGWTKGMLLIDTGTDSTVNDYELERYEGEQYMFVNYKGYEYMYGGKPTVLVLRRLDSKAYSKDELSRRDDINKPFVNDERVLGGWHYHSFIRKKEQFSPSAKSDIPPYFKHITFKENGECESVYGDEIIGGDMQSWTKGYVLRNYNQTACAYEIVHENGSDYMIIEWKSGDWRFGGFDTDYYVFEKECGESPQTNHALGCTKR